MTVKQEDVDTVAMPDTRAARDAASKVYRASSLQAAFVRGWLAAQARTRTETGGQRSRRLARELPVTAGKFELKRNDLGQYHFILKSGNGEIVCRSDGEYESKASAKNGIASIQRVAADATVIDLT